MYTYIYNEHLLLDSQVFHRVKTAWAALMPGLSSGAPGLRHVCEPAPYFLFSIFYFFFFTLERLEREVARLAGRVGHVARSRKSDYASQRER